MSVVIPVRGCRSSCSMRRDAEFL